MKLTNDQLRCMLIKEKYEQSAACEREAGGKIEINLSLPSVSVTMSDGSEYYFQGDDADDLLGWVPEWISAEDYILAMAQGW